MEIEGAFAILYIIVYMYIVAVCKGITIHSMSDIIGRDGNGGVRVYVVVYMQPCLLIC